MSDLNMNGVDDTEEVNEAVEKAGEAAFDAFKKVETDMTKVFENMDMAVPEAFRSIAEQTVTQSREAYEKTKDAMEEAVEALEQTIDKAGQGTASINRKVLDMTQSNLNSGFDYAKNLVGAKNVAEIMELQSTFLRKQFEAFTSQAEDMRNLTTKIATDTTSPLKDHMSKSVEKVMAL